ncbi:ribosomal subunit 39S-domain-containing protein [Aspergillus coremiiformis]|uniref:Large ribosomal subunit protein mL50 n=1 Tax=Aspergillus coremiiformis TaxID=138285 RepID=A0A5N6YUS4_9EURO|nr:ribosomal subunit 39S-domain-containing protein [Aspergillus coremiiformis]
MHPSLRLLNLEVSSLQGSRSLYFCSVCRQKARPRPVLARQFVRNSSNETPITERLRRKIWGTDNPPGMKDPYGGQGILERRFKKNQAERQEEQNALAQNKENSQSYENDNDSYEAATTWEGLERIGHMDRLSHRRPSEDQTFTPFVRQRKFTNPGYLSLAAHQAAVEICLMHTLNKPLAKVCKVFSHQEPVFKMIWECRIQSEANGQWSQAVVYPNEQAEEALAYIFNQIGGQREPAVVEETAEETVAETAEETAEETEQEVNESSEPEEFTPELNHSTDPFFGYKDVHDKGFLSLPLNHPATKFAFLKRFSQLSGHLIPDHVANSLATVEHVMNYVSSVPNPKRKNLACFLAEGQELQQLPNVKVFTKKQNRSHKDQELGRKKLIDAELRARGLIQKAT